MEATPTVQDLLLRIMQQQDLGFAEIRQSQAKIVDSVSRIDKDVALLQQAGKSLEAIPSRVYALESAQALHVRQLADVDRFRIDHEERIGSLEDTSSVRAGWEGMGGKVLYLMGGGALAALIGVIVAALRT